MKAMILAAGLGTRLRPTTEYMPKPAIPFLGIPIALYAVEYAIQIGATEVIINSHYLPEVLENKLRKHLEKSGIKFQFVREIDKILGSGGALKNCQKHFSNLDQIILCNGDEVILPNSPTCFSDLLKDHMESKAVATLLCMNHDLAGSKFGGVWTNSKNDILAFGKKNVRAAEYVFHYTGLCLLSPEIFNFLPDGESNILYDGVVSAIQGGHSAKAFVQDLEWYETGNEGDYILAHDSILNSWGKKNKNILKSAMSRFPSNPITEYLRDNQNPSGNIGLTNQPSQSEDSWNLIYDEQISNEQLGSIRKSIIFNSKAISPFENYLKKIII